MEERKVIRELLDSKQYTRPVSYTHLDVYKRQDFRDPRIWKEGNTFYAAVGSLGADGSGQIVLFSSQDAEEWRFESILDANGKQMCIRDSL